MNQRQSHDDLDWQAFCYAAGELTQTEAEQFETRLADDQDVREALARAVEMTQTVAAAESQHPGCVALASRARPAWPARMSWMAIGGVASLLLALLWSGVIGPTWRTAQQSFHAQSRQDLALAWYETRAQIAGVREAGLWPATGVNTDSDEELLDDVRADDVAVDDAPTWLTAAVFSMSDESPSPNESAEPSES